MTIQCASMMPLFTKEMNEGRLTTPTDVAQAIVADREFIAKISLAIWANIAPNLNLSNEAGSNPNASAVPEGQAEELNPGVSVDQTGISEKLCNCQSRSISGSIGSREETFGSKYRFRNAGLKTAHVLSSRARRSGKCEQ